MIIECPGCHTNYDIGNTLPPQGRNVRCASCNNVWLAKSETQLNASITASYENPAVSSGDITPPPDISNTNNNVAIESVVAETASQDSDFNLLRDFEPTNNYNDSPDINRGQYFDEVSGNAYTTPISDANGHDQPCDHATSNSHDVVVKPSNSLQYSGHDLNPTRPDPTSIGNEIEQAIGGITRKAPGAQPHLQEFNKLKLFGWVSVISAMVGALLFAFTDPDRIARALPSTVGIYDAIGIKTNSRGFTIDRIKYEHTTFDGNPALKVNGLVHNVTSEQLNVPTIIVELRDKDDLILFIWATEAEQRNLSPDAKTSFAVIIPAPTKLVRKVKLRFSTRP